MEVTERFMAKVFPVTESGCWIWEAACLKSGYGIFRLPHRTMLAHRFSYELANGPILDSQKVLHRCDVPSCVNPNHLFVGTNADNMRDMIDKDRQPWSKTHCPNGHERTEANFNSFGLCRVCDRNRHAKRYADRKGGKVRACKRRYH
jgi:hypothetical protein